MYHLTSSSRDSPLRDGDFQHADQDSHNVTTTRCRNINLLPIVYALRPELRGRLTLGGFTFPRKP